MFHRKIKFKLRFFIKEAFAILLAILLLGLFESYVINPLASRIQVDSFFVPTLTENIQHYVNVELALTSGRNIVHFDTSAINNPPHSLYFPYRLLKDSQYPLISIGDAGNFSISVLAQLLSFDRHLSPQSKVVLSFATDYLYTSESPDAFFQYVSKFMIHKLLFETTEASQPYLHTIVEYLKSHDSELHNKSQSVVALQNYDSHEMKYMLIKAKLFFFDYLYEKAIEKSVLYKTIFFNLKAKRHTSGGTVEPLANQAAWDRLCQDAQNEDMLNLKTAPYWPPYKLKAPKRDDEMSQMQHVSRLSDFVKQHSIKSLFLLYSLNLKKIDAPLVINIALNDIKAVAEMLTHLGLNYIEATKPDAPDQNRYLDRIHINNESWCKVSRDIYKHYAGVK